MLVVFMFLSLGGNAILVAIQQRIMRQLGIHIKTALTLAIFHKALKVNSVSRRGQSVGQIVTLMSADALAFEMLMDQVPVAVVAPVAVALCFVLLDGLVGKAVVAPVIFIIAIIPVNLVIFADVWNLFLDGV